MQRGLQGDGDRRPCCELCRPSRTRFNSMIRFFMAVRLRRTLPSRAPFASREEGENQYYIINIVNNTHESFHESSPFAWQSSTG